MTKEDIKEIIDGIWNRLAPKLAGKSDKNHTHSAQTDITGNAGTAIKLKTARKIGNASFDGSADITLAQMGAAASGHTHSNMKAATASAAGAAGLVPAPAAGAQGKYLRGDGTWQTPPNTVYTHPTAAGNKHIPAGGSSGQILRWSSDGTAAWGADNNTTYGNMKAATASAAGGAGLVPAPAAGAQAKFLRADGTWQNPPNTTYGNMGAATASAAGKAGLVPAPAAGAQNKFLRADGTWQNPPNTTYSAATQSANGLMTAADKKKLDGIAASANNYSHPTSAGNKHIPTGGSAGKILKWSASGTAVWGEESLPITGSITLAKASWVQDTTTKLYKQTKTISGLTAKHRVDLDIDYAVEMDLPAAIRPINNNGSFYAITAEPPTKDITAQYTLILTK